MAPKSTVARKLHAICAMRITVFTATLITCSSLIIATTLLFSAFTPTPNSSISSIAQISSTVCAEPHDKPDGGDCQAFGENMRRPKWACLSAMRQALPHFVTIYNKRPIRNNVGGMLVDHSFALWYVLLQIQPKVVIESGAFKGHSTWIIRQALPDARIISIDPKSPLHRVRGVEYLNGNKFSDFAEIDWIALGVNPAETLVFLDDHQSAYRRIMSDNVKHGFLRFIAEDSYPYPLGDNLSLKNVCEVKRKNMWRGFVQDNFGKNITKQTWEEHLLQGNKLNESLKIYYEMPPLASTQLTGQKRWDAKFSTVPLVTEAHEFSNIFGSMDKTQFSMYTHFTYFEVNAQLYVPTQ